MAISIKQSYHATKLLLHILLGIVLLVITGALWNNSTSLVKRVKQWWLNRVIYLMGIEVKVQGTPPRKTTGKGLLFISNHVSWIDIPLIGGQHQINFLSKDEVKSWPLIGRLAKGTGTLFIRRGNGDTQRIAKQIANYIDHDRSVLFFPEGTTSDGNQVRRFFPKLFRAAEHTAIDLCPIAVHYSVKGEPGNPVAFIGDDEFGSHLWRLLRYRNIEATIEFLPQRPLASTDLDKVVKLTQHEVAMAVAQLNQKNSISTNTQSPDASNLDDQNCVATNF